MDLLKDIPTLCTLVSGNYMRPDNVIISSSLANNFIQCNTIPADQPARTNHIPITMHLNVRLKAQTDPPWPNFKGTDWKEFRKELESKFKNLRKGEAILTEIKFL